MKQFKYKKAFFIVLVAVLTFALLPLTAFAAARDTAAASEAISVSVTPVSTLQALRLTPPKSDLAANPDFSRSVALAKATINGNCSITKLSSSSVNVYGYTNSSAYDPGVFINVQLQAYYNSAWHTLASMANTVSGTQASISQNYNVTTGYYYRVVAVHSISSGTTSYSNTGAILVN